jgi:hypothetical protein
MKLFYYQMSGNPDPYGPVEAVNEREARGKIRNAWDLKTLCGIGVWETNREAINAMR